MILLEVIDAERRKFVAALSPGLGTEEGPSRPNPPPSSIPQLPDYATSQALAETQNVEELKSSAKRSQWRIRRILVYVLVTYLVLSISIGIPLFILLRKDARVNSVSSSEMWMNQGSKLPPPPPPPDSLPLGLSNLAALYGSPTSCNNWSYVSATASEGAYYKLQYTMPMSNTLYIRSNFSQLDANDSLSSPLTGSLRVSVSDDTSQSNATVTVTMKDLGEDALKASSVCIMGADSRWGLSITVPDDASQDQYYFNVDLTLPIARADSRLYNLATYLPSFNQTFGRLDSYSNLDTVDVEGSLGSISFESVHAKNILVKSSAASITGTFNVTDQIIMETVLQPITANVSLYSDGTVSNPGLLNVENGNSDISLNVTLHSLTNPSAYCSPIFMSDLYTYNGAIDAGYTHDPSLNTSVLFLRSANSIEPARIFVDGLYEGTYDVRTTLADAAVNRTIDLVDPTGDGRTRVFEPDYVSTNRVYGWVGWGQRALEYPTLKGQIQIVSSLAPAILDLTGTRELTPLERSKSSAASQL